MAKRGLFQESEDLKTLKAKVKLSKFTCEPFDLRPGLMKSEENLMRSRAEVPDRKCSN